MSPNSQRSQAASGGLPSGSGSALQPLIAPIHAAAGLHHRVYRLGLPRRLLISHRDIAARHADHQHHADERAIEESWAGRLGHRDWIVGGVGRVGRVGRVAHCGSMLSAGDFTCCRPGTDCLRAAIPCSVTPVQYATLSSCSFVSAVPGARAPRP